jgi:O-antigen ligase
MSTLRKQRSVVGAALGFFLLAILHIPDNLFRYAFDKSAPVQFAVLMTLSAIFLIVIAIKSERFRFNKFLLYAVSALVIVQLISVFTSESVIGSLFGDSGRFVGFFSAMALITVAAFHTQFNLSNFTKLLWGYLVGIEAVVLLGLAQHFNLLEFPGAYGVASTFGNTDFFAAFVGTSYPLLILLGLGATTRLRLFLALLAILNFSALYFAGPLQGYVDVALTVIGLSIFLIRKKIPRFDWSLNVRTFLGTFAVIIYAEAIFLMPFLGDKIPVLGNDIQVKIRGNFWIDAIRQFFAHPLFGVGPDQYGSHYEQYRTLDDLNNYPDILSNDAHGAAVQTLATLGIFGTLAYIVLLAIVIRAILVLWDSRKLDRKITFVLGLYIFVYLSNSFISPITTSHKYLFWAVLGFIVGQVFRVQRRDQTRKNFTRPIALVALSVAIFSTSFFITGQANYLINIDRYGRDNSAPINYTPSPVIPCFMYFDAETLMVQRLGKQAVLELVNDELNDNPRCVSANIAKAQEAINTGDLTTLRKYAYRLHEIAPARGKSIEIGMYYATKAGDAALALSIQRIMKELNLIYIPGPAS